MTTVVEGGNLTHVIVTDDQTTTVLSSNRPTQIVDTGGGDTNTSNPGMIWRGQWSAVIPYQANDAVGYMGSSYISKTLNIDKTPATSPADWDLLAAAGSGGSTYVHTQSVPSATWIVNHGLGIYPNITVVNTLGDTVLGNISYTSLNQIVLSFTAAFSGNAYLS